MLVAAGDEEERGGGGGGGGVVLSLILYLARMQNWLKRYCWIGLKLLRPFSQQMRVSLPKSGPKTWRKARIQVTVYLFIFQENK